METVEAREKTIRIDIDVRRFESCQDLGHIDQPSSAAARRTPQYAGDAKIAPHGIRVAACFVDQDQVCAQSLGESDPRTFATTQRV
jgi:hypothetical protein